MANEKILVVEDESIVAMDIRSTLMRLGYDVPAIISSGDAAVRKAEELSLDLVLMDINLNGKMDGIEAAQQIHDRFDIPVVYLTAYSDENTLERAKVTEPFGYIIKPFGDRELHVAIKVALYKHKIDRRIKESEEKYRQLVESANSIIIRMKPSGVITFINGFAQHFFGYDEDEILGKNVLNTITPEIESTGRDLRKMIEDIGLRPDHYVNNLCENTCRDGKRVWIAWTNQPIRDEKGRIAEILCIGNDITVRKLAEEELQKAKERAESATRAKSEFLANMSHEIRTPLNGIIGIMELLMDTSLNREQHEYAEIAYKSGETLLSIINDILDFSKIEARKLELEIMDFDLRSLLKESTDLLAISAHEKGLALVSLIEPEVPSQLRGYPGRLRQILVNLGTNAVKFTNYGEIIIRISLEHEDERNVTLRFSVRDTGIGIPANRQDILFTPFTQLDGTAARKYGGTGLGLAISKQLAELMGGRVGLESKEGEGSTFWFTVVLEKQPARPGSADKKLAEIEGANETGRGARFCEEAREQTRAWPMISENVKSKIRILLAEDNIVNQRVAQAMLRKMGLRADIAANGREVIRELQSISYDLVLMDCQMPEIDGFEATRLIRNGSPGVLNPGVPIIAMTASTMQGDREKCINAGMSDFIAKPVQMGELMGVLARWLANNDG